MKTHWKKMRNPKYIGSHDLINDDGTFRTIEITIEKIITEMVMNGDGKADECTVARLAAPNKPLVLNATNLKAIAAAAGSDFIEDWVGLRLNLGVKKVRAFGGVHDALRVLGAATAPKLPVMDSSHPKYAGAVESLSKGGVTIEQIRKKMEVSDAVATAMLAEAEALRNIPSDVQS